MQTKMVTYHVGPSKDQSDGLMGKTPFPLCPGLRNGSAG